MIYHPLLTHSSISSLGTTLEDFSSFLSIEYATLVGDCAASYEGFTLTIAVPQLYRQMAY